MVGASVSRLIYLLSGVTDTLCLVVQLLNKMSEDPDQMEEIITETGKRMNLSLLEILSEKSLYKRRKSRKDFISQLLPDETTGDLDKDDILRLNRIQMRFSKKQIEEFIENNMEDEVMDASKINIADEEEFEKLILAYDYSTRKNSRYMVLEVEPEIVCCDMHPKYNSVMVAEELGLPVVKVQHHYAHILSCMAENDCAEQVSGVSFDGTGYGTDGTIWGGEILLSDLDGFTRVGSVMPFLQVGGDASSKEGWRIAVSLLGKI